MSDMRDVERPSERTERLDRLISALTHWANKLLVREFETN